MASYCPIRPLLVRSEIVGLSRDIPSHSQTGTGSSHCLNCNQNCFRYSSDSPVYTPEDGDEWMIAKLNVQTTDLGYSQIVEHLSKVHFVMEAVCVTMKRHLPSQHPLQQMMKYHCREVMIPNVFGGPKLLNQKGFMHLLFAFGDTGTRRLVKDTYPITTWDVTDFRENLKVINQWTIRLYSQPPKQGSFFCF